LYENTEVNIAAGRNLSLDVTLNIAVQETQVTIGKEAAVNTNPESNASAIVLNQDDIKPCLMIAPSWKPLYRLSPVLLPDPMGERFLSTVCRAEIFRRAIRSGKFASTRIPFHRNTTV
jgi:hypothetical protein